MIINQPLYHCTKGSTVNGRHRSLQSGLTGSSWIQQIHLIIRKTGKTRVSDCNIPRIHKYSSRRPTSARRETFWSSWRCAKQPATTWRETETHHYQRLESCFIQHTLEHRNSTQTGQSALNRGTRQSTDWLVLVTEIYITLLAMSDKNVYERDEFVNDVGSNTWYWYCDFINIWTTTRRRIIFHHWNQMTNFQSKL